MAIQETRTLPAQFVEDLGTDLAKQLVAQTGVPVVSTGVAGISQQPGETADQFAARQKAAEQFQIRQQSLSGLAPQVASQDPLQQQAQALATQGIGSYQPFLQAAQQATGPQAYQAYMSPYQQQVIDVSLAEFDRNKAIQEQQIRDQAIASGAFGGGREGVALAEYGKASDLNRAQLQAGLLQQGFGQAQQAAAQQYAQQTGLASLLPGLQSQDVSQLGTLGAINQAQSQAVLDAQREAARQATYLPQEQLDRYAGAVTGIMGGYPAAFQSTNVPNPTPLQTALGVGTTLAGIYGTVKNAGVNPFSAFKTN